MVQTRTLVHEAPLQEGESLDPYFALEITLPHSSGHGNGFMLRMWPDVIVTAGHVVRHATQVRAWTRSGDQERHFDCVKVAYGLPPHEPDLALLRTPAKISPSIDLDLGMAPNSGSGKLYAYPSFSGWQRKKLLFPETKFACDQQWIYYRDEHDQPNKYGVDGASGGPLFDQASDKVIGVHHGYFNITSTKVEHAATVCQLNFLMDCYARLQA